VVIRHLVIDSWQRVTVIESFFKHLSDFVLFSSAVVLVQPALAQRSIIRSVSSLYRSPHTFA